ncbi:hypothetical protein RhiirA4_485517 [Rhizophagus irregularis]|uniref:DUF8211 domain-containing protein n=1 Tax=Rhizophagus irregularis TaxID=588596 RepID=A0A2I1HQ86_9GLOM|nr:hypothetical protein RhiirA4_485517 [Rhizophagus irregularis]
MSNNRYDCIAHNNKIQLYSHNLVKNPDEINISLDSKDFYARRLYNRWHNSRIKNNFSNRLGLTFSTRYSVSNINSILCKGNTNIYYKVYDNFNYGFSRRDNVQKKQRQRLDRKCNKIFRDCDIKDDASMEDKLLASKKKKFLFHPEQSFKKPILHLQYKKKYNVPVQKYYNFKLPSLDTKFSDCVVKREVHIAHYFDSNRHDSVFDPSQMISHFEILVTQDLSCFSNIRGPASPFIPKASTLQNKDKKSKINVNDWISAMQALRAEDNTRQKAKREEASSSQVKKSIPDDLLPYIPDEPIYKDGRVFSLLTKKEKKNLKPLEAGSKSWITAIRSIKKNADDKRQREIYFDNLSSNWNTSKTIAEECENFSSTLTHYQNSLYALISSDFLISRECKRPAGDNFNLDSHYNLHMKKKF